MRERPILFSGPMVQAILAGTKTQTRRVVKPQPAANVEGAERQVAAETCIDAEPGTHFFRWLEPAGVSAGFRCPYGQPGDRLWVRETFTVPPGSERPAECIYRADVDPELEREARRVSRQHPGLVGEGRWTPAIHMPRWASRITLEVTEVRIQRLQDISEEDAEAEGIPGPQPFRHPGGDDTLSAREEFAALWDSINAARGYSWASNPWVFALTFRRIDR